MVDTDGAARTADAAEVADGPRYEVITIAYFSADEVAKLLAGLEDHVPVAVIDNCQGQDGLADVARARPRTRYLHGPGRGFASGANLGARTSAARTLVYADPDSRPSTAQIEEIVRDIEADPGLAAVAMNSVLPDGRPDIGVGGWEPSVPRAIAHAVGAHRIVPTAGLWAVTESGREVDLDWLGGSCLATPRRVFLELGGYDESFFLYSEDIDLGRRIRKAGYRLRLRTDITVDHDPGGSGDDPTRMIQLRADSMMRYLRRHHPAHRVQGVRLALSAGTAARALYARLRGRHDLTEHFAAYLRGLWAGRPAGM